MGPSENGKCEIDLLPGGMRLKATTGVVEVLLMHVTASLDRGSDTVLRIERSCL